MSNSFDQIAFSGSPDGTTTYTLATYSSLLGTFNFGPAPAGYQLIYGTNELDLAPVAVTEPRSWFAAMLALGAIAYIQRRRKGTTRRARLETDR